MKKFVVGLVTYILLLSFMHLIVNDCIAQYQLSLTLQTQPLVFIV